MTHHIGWSEPRTQTLVNLWAEGLSASQIMRQLGGTTRNAVISKVHRIGLPLRGQQRLTSASARKMKRAKARKLREPKPKPQKPPTSRHLARIKPLSARPVAKPNKFDASPASQAAMALLGAAYKREGLRL